MAKSRFGELVQVSKGPGAVVRRVRLHMESSCRCFVSSRRRYSAVRSIQELVPRLVSGTLTASKAQPTRLAVA